MSEGLRRYQEIFGHAEKTRALGAAIARLAGSSAPVLIKGEPGVGKEVVAEALHALSGRPQTPFTKIRCGSLPTDLLEARIFGPRDEQTLLIQDIDWLPQDLQARLAAVL